MGTAAVAALLLRIRIAIISGVAVQDRHHHHHHHLLLRTSSFGFCGFVANLACGLWVIEDDGRSSSSRGNSFGAHGEGPEQGESSSWIHRW